MNDSLRIKVSFILSLILHTILTINIKIIHKKQPIIISYPVELITLPPAKPIEQISIYKKKEPDTVLPKEKIKPKPKIEQKEVKQEKLEQETKPVQPSISQSVSLETAKFPFTYYVKQIREKIVKNWAWAQSYSGELKTVIYFKILKDGRIKDITFKETSPNYLYNNLCLRAIELSVPFPPLPEGYNEEYLGVYFEFKYHE